MTALILRFFIIFATFYATSVSALTAVCKEPTGRILGMEGTALGNGQPLDEPDGMKGGLFSIVWNGQDRAQIISQGSGGGEPLPDTGVKVFEGDGQVSFLVMYSSALWFYSLFPDSEVLLITAHNNGLSIDAGGAVIKAYMAKCEVSK